jgi:hypothetical protein
MENLPHPKILEWLAQDKHRTWQQSRPHPNRFGSNFKEALYVFEDHILYWENYEQSNKYVKHDVPDSKTELDKILTRNPAQKKPSDSENFTKSISDDFGNLLVSRKNGNRIVISLKLVGDNRYRRIGTINEKRKVIDMERKRNIHLFRKSSSYGFNHNLLKQAKLFDKVRLRDEYGEWLIPVEYILENGHFLNFKQNGFELQIFLPLDKMKEFERQPKV